MTDLTAQSNTNPAVATARIDPDALHRFVLNMVSDLGAAGSAALVLAGDKLGLYKALTRFGPLTPVRLAELTGTAERYIREWLCAQAAAGYVSYDDPSDAFHMTPEQSAVFADEDSPVFMAGGFHAVASLFVDEPRVTEAFKTGAGVSWGDHSECLFCGTEKFFRPGYLAHLIADWIPALDGVVEKLRRGAKVADVGCGHGASTLVMAQAFPESTFHGFDIHGPSIEYARQRAAEAGVKNVTFAVATAKSFPGQDYDLVAYFDCLHDMGDPVGGMIHARRALKPDGTLLLVEPFAHDELRDNLNPIGRVYFNFSTMVCTPNSLSQEGGAALGAQAGEKRLRQVVEAGGFAKFRRATETPFNLILEARP